MRNLKALQTLCSKPSGSPVNDDVAAEVRRVFDDDVDTEEFLAMWLSEENHAAFRIQDRMVWTFRAKGQVVLVDLAFTAVDREEHADFTVYGYETEEAAYQDACKLLLEWVLADADIRHMTGWLMDTVMLVKGSDWYCVRTYRNGRVSVTGSEEPFPAYSMYVKAVDDLATEIESGWDIPGIENNWIYRKIATAFIQREAGNALAAFARHSLTLAIDGGIKLQNAGGLKINMSELARNLYTDRPNLTKLQGKSTLS